MRPVHYFDTSGTILCRGLSLADAEASRPRAEDPLRITLDRCEVTCMACRAVLERLDREAAA